MVIPPRTARGGGLVPCGDIALLLKRVQKGIERPGLEVERVLRPAAQRLDHLIAVHVLLLEQLQKQHPRAPGQQGFVEFHSEPPLMDR